MRNTWIYGLAIIALILGVYLAITIAPPKVNGNDLRDKTEYLQWYPEPRKLAEFSLQSHKGMTMTNSDLQGKWTLVFVGYTFCPDICPVTLAQLNSIYPELTNHVTRVPLQVWFLSVDPNRDTVERLNEYIGYFNPDFIAATGEHSQLFPLVRSMGMMYSIAGSTDDPNYLVDHSGSIAVINPDGHIIGRFKPQHVPGQLATSDAEQIKVDVPILLSHD